MYSFYQGSRQILQLLKWPCHTSFFTHAEPYCWCEWLMWIYFRHLAQIYCIQIYLGFSYNSAWAVIRYILSFTNRTILWSLKMFAQSAYINTTPVNMKDQRLIRWITTLGPWGYWNLVWETLMYQPNYPVIIHIYPMPIFVPLLCCHESISVQNNVQRLQAYPLLPSSITFCIKSIFSKLWWYSHTWVINNKAIIDLNWILIHVNIYSYLINHNQ